MTSLFGDLSVLVGLVALLICVLLSTLSVNRSRKMRLRGRRITARLLNWK